MLNIKDALKLYELLQPHLPDSMSGSVLDFTGKVIKNIKTSESPEDFSEILMLMYDYELSDLTIFSGVKLVELFIEGLLDNQIISLVDSCKQLGL